MLLLRCSNWLSCFGERIICSVLKWPAGVTTLQIVLPVLNRKTAPTQTSVQLWLNCNFRGYYLKNTEPLKNEQSQEQAATLRDDPNADTADLLSFIGGIHVYQHSETSVFVHERSFDLQQRISVTSRLSETNCERRSEQRTTGDAELFSHFVWVFFFSFFVF